MAITSIGYDGTVDEVQWAKLSQTLGGREGVLGAGHWAVSTVSGVDRTVAIASGSGFGQGVRDDSDAITQVQLPTLASGTRWDTVVARRDWGANATTFTYVQGTSTQAIAAGLNDNPGVIADQPIALVQITAGTQVPTALVDLRTWPGKVVFANTLPDAGKYLVGTIASVGADLYRRESPGGAPTWVKMFSAPAWSTLSLSGSVVGFSGNTPQWRVVGDAFELRGTFNPSGGGKFTAGTWYTVTTLSASVRPVVGYSFVIAAYGLTASTYNARCEVLTDGTVRVKVASDANITEMTLDGIRFSLS